MHVHDTATATARWLQLPVSTSSYITLPHPNFVIECDDIDTLRTNTNLQHHNMLIYYLTLGHRPSLPTYYLHDPTDLSPPLVFASSNPRWVEIHSRNYAWSRFRINVSAVVGIYIDLPNDGIYMIATYHVLSNLFVPLPNRIPLANSTMFYSTIQLSNVNQLLGNSLGTSVARFSPQYDFVIELIYQSRNEERISQLTPESLSNWFSWCQRSLELDQ